MHQTRPSHIATRLTAARARRKLLRFAPIYSFEEHTMRVAIRDYAVVLAVVFGAHCAPAIAADGYPAKAIRISARQAPSRAT